MCHTNKTDNTIDVNHGNATKTTINDDHQNVNTDKKVKKIMSHVHCPRCQPRLTALGVSVQG